MPEILDDEGYVIEDHRDVGALLPYVERPDSGSYSNLHRKYVTEEDAFRIYRSTGSRSLRNTAEFLGIPYGTVASWSKRHGWQQRSSDLDLEATEGVMGALAVAIVGQQIRNIGALAKIRDEGEDRDAVNAAKELNRVFERMADRMQLSGVLSLETHEDDEEDLVALAATPEGAQELLRRQRERTGKY